RRAAELAAARSRCAARAPPRGERARQRPARGRGEDMRTGRALLVAILLLTVAGTALLLLAFDVRAWQHTVAGDDVRFAAGPRRAVRWQAATTLPGDPAGGLLGVSSSVRYRRAALLFRTVTKGANANGQGDDAAAAVTSADAQTALAAVVEGSAADTERSRAANLLGVLVVTSP